MPTTIAISSFQIPDLNFAGSTFKLRRYYDSDWQDVDGVLHLAGTPGSATDSFDEIDCTLVSHTGTVPSFNATPTLTALINQNVRETWQLWDEAGSARNIIAENWFIPASPATITRGALEIENRGQSLLWPPSWYLNALQVQQLIDAQIGLLNHASSVIEGRTFLDVDPLVAITPEAVGSNSPVIPGFVLHTSKYASLNLAITAITALGGGTIVVDSSTPVTSNVATTASIAVRGEGQGMLTGSSKTVTFVGPFSSEPVQRFASGITVSFAGNKSLKNLHANWWAKGDGVTDDTAALNAVGVAAATLFGCTVNFTPQAVYNHTGLTFDHLGWVTFLGSDSETIIAITAAAPRLVYTGSAGGTMITMNNCYGSTFRGFYLGDDGTDPPDVGIDLTMTVGGTPPISSQNMIAYNVFDGNTRTGWICIKIDNASQANNEQHIIHGNYLVGGQQSFPDQTGIGVYLGHVNVKQVIITRNAFTGLAKFVSSASGSFRAAYNRGGASMVMYYGTVSDAISIENDDTESLCQVADLEGAAHTIPIRIVGGRYADLRGGQVVSATTNASPVLEASNLTVVGNTFSAQGEFTSDFILDQSGGQTPLIWDNNVVYNNNNGSMPVDPIALYTGFNTFASVRRFGGRPGPSTGQGGETIGGNANGQNSLQGTMSTPMVRDVIGVQQDTGNVGAGLTVAAQDSVAIGESGQIEIVGLARPMRPEVSVVGTAGAVSYIFAIIARDSLGNRTMPSYLNQSTVTANATLTGSNYLHVTWPKVPGVTDYLLLQFSAGTWRTVATVVASGTNEEEYDVVANPAGAFTYVIPTYNETATLKFRGASTFTSTSPIAFTPSSPAELVANTNNWNPGGTAPFASSIIRFSTDVSRNITGLTFTKTQTSGQVHLLVNVGLADAVLVHQSGLSTAAHRFYNFSAANITLAPKQAALVEYDATNAYWLVYPLGLVSIATGVSGLGANVATFLGTPSSANLAAAVTGESGTGALIFGTEPTVSLLVQPEGAALSISSNTITPTDSIHQVGAGLIKTITVPAGFTSGTIALVPTAAFTYDATGNVLGTGTAVVGRTMFATYSSSTSKWSMSY